MQVLHRKLVVCNDKFGWHANVTLRHAANRCTPFPTTKRVYDRDLGLVCSEASEAAGMDMLA